MAKNWMAYEAAEAIMGNNVEEIAEVGSRYPLFTRTVSMANSDYVLDLLKAIPKVTARVIETGLKDIDDVETEAVDEAPKKETKAKKEVDEDETEESSYESMTSKELYALCCERGISSLCKSRKKDALIELLEKYDAGEIEKTSGRKKAEKTETKKATKSEKKSESEENWDDDEENWDDEEKNPYEGKTAKELFKMCTDRGIKTKPKQSADAYVKLLKKADEAEAETDDEDDEDDDWEI